jgi:hypothetical protein
MKSYPLCSPDRLEPPLDPPEYWDKDVYYEPEDFDFEEFKKAMKESGWDYYLDGYNHCFRSVEHNGIEMEAWIYNWDTLEAYLFGGPFDKRSETMEVLLGEFDFKPYSVAIQLDNQATRLIDKKEQRPSEQSKA